MRRLASIYVSAAAVLSVGTVAMASATAVGADGAVGSAAPIERVVTLGDSYASGAGIHRDASDYDDHGPETHAFDAATRLGSTACHRELDETPGARLADELGAEATMVACAGAVVADIANQLAAADVDGAGEGVLFAVTVGGNDLRSRRGETWGDVLVRCITTFGCDDDANRAGNLTAVQRDLTELYTSIGERYPEATVRVLGYPRLMQRDRWGCSGVTGVGPGEAAWIDDQVDLLNHAIRSAAIAARVATGADLAFVSVEDEFDNHGACRFWQRDRYVNDAVFGETYERTLSADGAVGHHWDGNPANFSIAAFHPSTRGYDAYLRALTPGV